MAKLVWDQTGERQYETGVSKGVLYPFSQNKYQKGVAWNGLTGVTESPSGAEATALYADNIKYLNLMSAEEFGATIEAYTYPDEFGQCNGEGELAQGVTVGQQKRSPFGMSYQTKIGDDTDPDKGYKIHLIYGAQAAPSEKAYATVNDSPEAITFSWEVTTTPIEVPGMKPTASLTIDSTKVLPSVLKKIEDILYGTERADPRLPLPSEIIEILGSVPAIAISATSDTPILGKNVSEFQSNINIGDSKITGTLNYIEGFTEFNGSDPTEQEGNYLFLNFKDTVADQITSRLIGGKNPNAVDCTSDKWMLYLVTAACTGVEVNVTKDGMTNTKVYDISELTLTPNE